MTDIPELEETGSAGTQESGTPEDITTSAMEPAFEGIPIVESVKGLAANRSRSMGGEVAANLLAGTVSQISFDHNETKKELKTTRNELRDVNNSLSNCRERVAVLGERVRAISKIKHVGNFCIFAGTTFFGVGIELFRKNLIKSSIIVGGLGVLMILFGWFSFPGEEKE